MFDRFVAEEVDKIDFSNENDCMFERCENSPELMDKNLKRTTFSLRKKENSL